MITIGDFSEHNRDRIIGKSLYRICRTEDEYKKWYIHETYNDGIEWACNNAFYSYDLQETINKINSFTKEREVVSLRFGK